MSREVVFVAGIRTAFGTFGKTLRGIMGEELAGMTLKGLVEKSKIIEKGGVVDGVFMGSAMGPAEAMNGARWPVLASGLPMSTSASWVEMQCGSAIDSINHAAWKILAGVADIMIAGGYESYSKMPIRFPFNTEPYKMMPPMPIMPSLSPTRDPATMDMGQTAEALRMMYNISREAQDEFSLRSQQRTQAAIASGFCAQDIMPITIPQGKKPPIEFKEDEFPRADTTMEGLAKLRPAFVFDGTGTVTAGNSSGRNDGAAFVLMMTKEKAEQLGFKPWAKWLSSGDYGVDPKIMGIAPAYAVPMALKRAGIKMKQLDVIECNEAFAVQNLAVAAELEKQTGDKVDWAKWNPNGGAISYGHPNGASGARIGIFTMRELMKKGGKYGCFSSCCGGGLGVATVIENLQK
jgi:acetyl-CoA acetyltransferase family protein